MTHSLPLKAALKRGALVAAANWPLVFVQFIAEATLKLLLAVPTIGGVFLVMLLLQADVEDVLGGSLRDIAGTVFTALRANPIALVAFALAFLIVLFAGSALTFVVKGGTVSLLAVGGGGRRHHRAASAASRRIETPRSRAHRSISRCLQAFLAPLRPARRMPADRVHGHRRRVSRDHRRWLRACGRSLRSCSDGRWLRRWHPASSSSGSRSSTCAIC